MTQTSIVSGKSKTVGGQAIAITGATNAAPISITATAHGLETGDIVQNSGDSSSGNLRSLSDFCKVHGGIVLLRYYSLSCREIFLII